MKKNILMLLAVLIVLSSQSYALWGGMGGRPDRHGFINRLDLTDKQKEKFKAQMEKVERELKPIFEKVKEKTDKLKKELQEDQPDRNAIHEYIKGIDSLRTNMELKRVDSLLELRKTLTPEQREKFKKMTGPQSYRDFGGLRKHR